MGAVDAQERIRTVEAQINYVAPGSFINRRFVAPGVEHNTGSFEPHLVTVRDGRPVKNSFTLDAHGFVLADRPSAVRDFMDKDEVDRIYPAEVVEAVKALTGATRVATLGWMIRTSGDTSKVKQPKFSQGHQGGVQPPAADAHVDMTPDRAERMAQAIYERSFPDGKGYSRFIASSFWRTFSEPPQDCPLAVCDARSVGAEEGVPNVLYIVDKIPEGEAMFAPMPDADQMAAAIFRYNPNHRWWYFSGMNRDEALLLKFHDSDHSVAWRTPHTAFWDTSFPDRKVRASIECRSVAFFE